MIKRKELKNHSLNPIENLAMKISECQRVKEEALHNLSDLNCELEDKFFAIHVLLVDNKIYDKIEVYNKSLTKIFQEVNDISDGIPSCSTSDNHSQYLEYKLGHDKVIILYTDTLNGINDYKILDIPIKILTNNDSVITHCLNFIETYENHFTKIYKLLQNYNENHQEILGNKRKEIYELGNFIKDYLKENIHNDEKKERK